MSLSHSVCQGVAIYVFLSTLSTWNKSNKKGQRLFFFPHLISLALGQFRVHQAPGLFSTHLFMCNWHSKRPSHSCFLELRGYILYIYCMCLIYKTSWILYSTARTWNNDTAVALNVALLWFFREDSSVLPTITIMKNTLQYLPAALSLSFFFLFQPCMD